MMPDDPNDGLREKRAPEGETSPAGAEAWAPRQRPGDRVSEYILEERIGRGGFGDVWRARHHALGDRLVAIKIPGDSRRAALLKREGVLQDRLRHPNAVEVLGMDADHDPPYLVMELVEGESLRARLEREKRLPMADAVDVAMQVLGALEHAHARGVVHRDLKPENVLLARSGRAKLTDFGLGRLLESERARLALSGALMSEERGELGGTLAYMAPEQREAGRPIDARADLYAFGIVLFEMVTGARPEGAEAPSDLVAGLDPRVDRVFRGCYCRLEKRYATAGAIIHDLAPLARHDAVEAAAGPLGAPVAHLEVDGDPRGVVGGRIWLRAAPQAIEGGAAIERHDDAWWIVQPWGGSATRVFPAHVPSGRAPEEFAEKVGAAPIKLASGVAVEVAGSRFSSAARYVFRDGHPFVPEAHGDLIRPATSSAFRTLVRILSFAIALGLGTLGVLMLTELHAAAPSALLFVGALAALSVAIGARDRAVPATAVPVHPALEPAQALHAAARRPAGFFVRLIAVAIDVCLFCYLAEVVPVAVPAGLFVYDWLLNGLAGATVGKYLLGLRVVREDGRPLGLLRGLGRTLSKVLSALPIGLGFALAAITPSKQSLHDFFAGSRVVHRGA